MKNKKCVTKVIFCKKQPRKRMRSIETSLVFVSHSCLPFKCLALNFPVASSLILVSFLFSEETLDSLEKRNQEENNFVLRAKKKEKINQETQFIHAMSFIHLLLSSQPGFIISDQFS